MISPPFDIGNTTENGLSILSDEKYRKSKYAFEEAKEYN
jgi:hypothetical protein